MNPTQKLGIPATIGELKEMIAKYPDNTPFGFRNQPIQQLVEDTYDDTLFVSFDEITELKLPVVHKMKIASYKKEAEILEKVLRSDPGCGIIPFQYTKTVMENNDEGFDFEITTEGDYNGLIFYWIGVEFAKRVMRYNLKRRFALNVIGQWDDENDNNESDLLEALEYCKEAFEFSGVEDFAKGGLKESAYNKTIAVLQKFKQLPDEN